MEGLPERQFRQASALQQMTRRVPDAAHRSALTPSAGLAQLHLPNVHSMEVLAIERLSGEAFLMPHGQIQQPADRETRQSASGYLPLPSASQSSAAASHVGSGKASTSGAASKSPAADHTAPAIHLQQQQQGQANSVKQHKDALHEIHSKAGGHSTAGREHERQDGLHELEAPATQNHAGQPSASTEEQGGGSTHPASESQPTADLEQVLVSFALSGRAGKLLLEGLQGAWPLPGPTAEVPSPLQSHQGSSASSSLPADRAHAHPSQANYPIAGEGGAARRASIPAFTMQRLPIGTASRAAAQFVTSDAVRIASDGFHWAVFDHSSHPDVPAVELSGPHLSETDQSLSAEQSLLLHLNAHHARPHTSIGEAKQGQQQQQQQHALNAHDDVPAKDRRDHVSQVVAQPASHLQQLGEPVFAAGAVRNSAAGTAQTPNLQGGGPAAQAGMPASQAPHQGLPAGTGGVAGPAGKDVGDGAKGHHASGKHHKRLQSGFLESRRGLGAQAAQPSYQPASGEASAGNG